jgi:dephospho-CoA kinase
MIVLGITGSIGMGKTVLAGALRDMGIPVHDADATVHTLLATAPEIRTNFPEAYEDGALSRKKLGKHVYSDPARRKQLESILHPLVRADRRAWLDEQTRVGHPIAAIDVPLLFETGLDTWCHYIICVTASPEVQQQRVMSRPGMTAERFEKILSLQMPDAQKRALADATIHTDTGLGETRAQAAELVENLRKGALPLRHVKNPACEC